MPTEPAPVAARTWLAGCIVHRSVTPGAPERQIVVNGRPVTATLHSGSAITLVQRKARGKTTIPIICVHGDTRQVPAQQVTISAPTGAWALEVGVVSDLPVPVLLGRDWLGFEQLLTAAIPLANRRAHQKESRGRQPVLMANESEHEGESQRGINNLFLNLLSTDSCWGLVW